MLVLEVINISTKTGETADYRVNLRVNRRVLWRGRIEEHPRERGAVVLLHRVINELEEAEKRGEVQSVRTDETEVSD